MIFLSFLISYLYGTHITSLFFLLFVCFVIFFILVCITINIISHQYGAVLLSASWQQALLSWWVLMRTAKRDLK